MNSKILLLCLLTTLFLSSCITNKDVVYLQDKGTVIDSLSIQEASKPYRLNVNDQLKIAIKTSSETHKELVSTFNTTATTPGNTQEDLYFSGNTVDVHGNIDLPEIGAINVLGYTLDELEAKLRKILFENYFKEGTVELYITIKLPGLKYSVLGEINKTGPQVLFQDRVNIIDAIANAGDITQTGDKKDVLIVRQYPQGQKIHHIDLTDIAAMQSEFYYIQPNDVIMVKPLKRKVWGAGQTVTQTITTIASIFSIIVSTYFLARNL